MGRIGYRRYLVFNLSILIRALHQAGAAVFLAAYLLDDLPAPPSEYATIAALTGVLFFASEWLRHRQVCCEFSGVITLVKLLFLGAAYHGFMARQGTVLLVFILASIGSHAHIQLRHRLLF